jgi:hypothetical protein
MNVLRFSLDRSEGKSLEVPIFAHEQAHARGAGVTRMVWAMTVPKRRSIWGREGRSGDEKAAS